jgi:hypothetical protein
VALIRDTLHHCSFMVVAKTPERTCDVCRGGQIFRQIAGDPESRARRIAGIGTTAETWQARLEKPREGRQLGRFLAASRRRLKEAVQRLGLRRAIKLASCLVTGSLHEALT